MKTRLTTAELTSLANAYVLSKLADEELKTAKSNAKTAELQTTVIGEAGGKTVHKPYKLDGVVEIQVIDSFRESIDTTALISKLAEYVDMDKLNEIVEQCKKVAKVHTVNIKPDKAYMCEVSDKVNATIKLLNKLESMKEEVRNKVLAMINKA